MRYTNPADVKKTIDNVIVAIRNGESFHTQMQKGGNGTYGPLWNSVRDTIKKQYANLFVAANNGTRERVIRPQDANKIDANAVLASVMGVKGVVPFSVRTTQTTAPVDETVDGTEEILPYSEQLGAARTCMELLMAGATNGLFLGGRGGVGKTVQVENMLAKAGKEDGCGYFKISGSASAPGVYRALYENRNGMILFDDSDKALFDVDARSYLKAATDTKKVRKICCTKAGRNFVDPADMPEDGEDAGDKLPRHFEFTGRIIFISNLSLDRLDPDGALRTRGYVMNIDPSNEEVYDYMTEIVEKIQLEPGQKLTHAEKLEVIDVLRARKIAPKTANLRSLERGLKARATLGAGDRWKKIARVYC